MAAHCVGHEDSKGNYFCVSLLLHLNKKRNTNCYDMVYSYLTERFANCADPTERLFGGVVSRVSNIVLNENYADFLHDLALLRLETPLIFFNNI